MPLAEKKMSNEEAAPATSNQTDKMQPNDFYTINTKWNYTNASVQMNGDVFLNKLQFYIVVADFHFIIHSFLLSLRVFFFILSFFMVCECVLVLISFANGLISHSMAIALPV